MRPTESGPLEDLFRNPLVASLRALAFREGGIQGQVDDASQILLAPCRSKEPGSFGESGTHWVTEVRGLNSLQRRNKAGVVGEVADDQLDSHAPQFLGSLIEPANHGPDG